MPKDERKLGLAEFAVENVQVGAAHAASRQFDEDLVWAGLRYPNLGEAKLRSGRVQNHCLHRPSHRGMVRVPRAVASA